MRMTLADSKAPSPEPSSAVTTTTTVSSQLDRYVYAVCDKRCTVRGGVGCRIAHLGSASGTESTQESAAATKYSAFPFATNEGRSLVARTIVNQINLFD